MILYYNIDKIQDSPMKVFKGCFLAKMIYETESLGKSIYLPTQESTTKFISGDILEVENTLIFRFSDIPKAFCSNPSDSEIHYLLGFSEDLSTGLKISSYRDLPLTELGRVDTSKCGIRALKFTEDSLNTGVQCYSLQNTFKAKIITKNSSFNLTTPSFENHETTNAETQVFDIYDMYVPAY